MANGGTLYDLSEQQLVDCDTKGDAGCNGGFYYWAWEWLETNGQEETSAYPYTAADGTCKYNSALGKVANQSPGPYVNVSNANVVGTVTVLAGESTSAQNMAAIDVKPNAVAVNASSFGFQTYKSGILDNANCSTSCNHAITAVGYNSDGATPYYIVRNSWGAAWGDAGYINIAMATGKGICGINQFIAYSNTSTWAG